MQFKPFEIHFNFLYRNYDIFFAPLDSKFTQDSIDRLFAKIEHVVDFIRI
jgi:hypothetical protein